MSEPHVLSEADLRTHLHSMLSRKHSPYEQRGVARDLVLAHDHALRKRTRELEAQQERIQFLSKSLADERETANAALRSDLTAAMAVVRAAQRFLNAWDGKPAESLSAKVTDDLRPALDSLPAHLKAEVSTLAP